MFDGKVERFADVVRKLIASKREGNYWDFKREWHSDKTELLHDIICLANNLNQDGSYLIIGVDEENDYCICDVADAKIEPAELFSMIEGLHRHGLASLEHSTNFGTN